MKEVVKSRSESAVRVELLRPYKGDTFVDITGWENKPSEQLVKIFGDLSDSRNLTSFKAVQIAAEVIHLHSSTATTDVSPEDIRYAMNVFGFVVDNRKQLGWISQEEDNLLRDMSAAMEVARFEGSIRNTSSVK